MKLCKIGIHRYTKIIPNVLWESAYDGSFIYAGYFEQCACGKRRFINTTIGTGNWSDIDITKQESIIPHKSISTETGKCPKG